LGWPAGPWAWLGGGPWGAAIGGGPWGGTMGAGRV